MKTERGAAATGRPRLLTNHRLTIYVIIQMCQTELTLIYFNVFNSYN